MICMRIFADAILLIYHVLHTWYALRDAHPLRPARYNICRYYTMYAFRIHDINEGMRLHFT